MNILVTGAAGYLGSILVPLLLDQGYGVTALDNFLFGQSPLLDIVWKKKLTIVRGDVRDNNVLKDLISKHDVIIPLACLVGAPLCDKDPYAAEQVNLAAIENLCKMKSKNQLVIFPCTNSGYGIGEKNTICDEKSPLRPISLYGRLKVEAEKRVLSEENGITFRFATLFGVSPKMRIDLLVNDFVYRAVNDRAIVLFEADFKRNYLHVRDAAAAFIFALNNYSRLKGEAYNVGLSDSNLSKRELCDEIKKVIPQFVYTESDHNEDPDKRNYIICNKKIEKAGYLPRISLRDGIIELIKGYEIIQPTQWRNA